MNASATIDDGVKAIIGHQPQPAAPGQVETLATKIFGSRKRSCEYALLKYPRGSVSSASLR
jgi:hypothetical protein